MSILEELWYGNIDPAEYDACPSSEYKELIRLISRNVNVNEKVSRALMNF